MDFKSHCQTGRYLECPHVKQTCLLTLLNLDVERQEHVQDVWKFSGYTSLIPLHTPSQISGPQSQSVFVFVAHLQSVVVVWPHSVEAGGRDGVGVGKEWDHLIKISALLVQAE